MGLRHQKTHTLCRRCGRMSYHKQKHTCSGCGYPAARTRKCMIVLMQMDGHSKLKTVKELVLVVANISKKYPESIRTSSRDLNDEPLFNTITIHNIFNIIQQSSPWCVTATKYAKSNKSRVIITWCFPEITTLLSLLRWGRFVVRCRFFHKIIFDVWIGCLVYHNKFYFLCFNIYYPWPKTLLKNYPLSNKWIVNYYNINLKRHYVNSKNLLKISIITVKKYRLKIFWLNLIIKIRFQEIWMMISTLEDGVVIKYLKKYRKDLV